MTRHVLKATLCTFAALWVLSACGGDDATTAGGGADRVIKVSMVDNAFDPNSIDVSAGETVTFEFTNEGALAHDAFIGTAQEQDKHGKEMDSGDHGGHNMEGGDALLLEPGDSGELTYTFEDAGEVFIGCHQPGHYEAGMKSTITVS